MEVGHSVENFELNLINGQKIDLYSLLDKGPVILNFIMGTWCPICTSHLSKIRGWQKKLNKNVTMLIISSESKESLLTYQDKNRNSYLYASDNELKIINLFDLKLTLMNLAKPATYLIDTDKKVKISFNKIRTRKTRETFINDACQICD